jgi:pyruvate dehydrogenase E1 component alpha subunit
MALDRDALTGSRRERRWPPYTPPADSASHVAARFEIRFTRFVDHHGRVLAPLPDFAQDAAELRAMYRNCVLTRAFDAKAVALQRTGRLGTFPSSLGQEGTAIAIGMAMRPDDVLLPTYRETGALLVRGVRMTDVLLYWGGDERGMAFSRPAEDFPICVPIATHATQAAGVAFAMKHRGEARAAVCAIGDGGTSKGDFYEALNGAGVWRLPLVFVVVNNEWAISMPRSRQTAARTLAQKAIAAGIPGEQVDGDDAVAVRHAVAGALAKARADGGPHLIEALTYRASDHTTDDDASRYREDHELERRRELDPVERLRKLLQGLGVLRDADERALAADCEAAVEQAAAEYLAIPPRAPETMFDHLFATLPAALAAEREEVARLGRVGKEERHE